MPFPRLSTDKRALVLAGLTEGMPINGVCRTFNVGKMAVLRFLAECGAACEDWHHRHFRDLTVTRLEIDEQWSFCGIHRERMKPKQKGNPFIGDAWLWVALDPVSKCVIAWRTGKRKQSVAAELLEDVADRIEGRFQLTTDALKSYENLVPGLLRGRVDYATEKKVFAKDKAPAQQWNVYSVNPLAKVERKAVCGRPDLSKATIAHAERLFLGVRQSNKRTARKTLAYSKKWENHGYMASIHLFVQNMCRRHSSIGDAPAVVLGVINKRWNLQDVVRMTDEYLRRMENEAFEAAFKGFTVEPKSSRTYAPQAPNPPWYLDENSGGPNPPPQARKQGIQYEDSEDS